MNIKLNGCNIYYEVHGNEAGETIFFIHGAPGLGDCRADQGAFKSLGLDYRLVFLDMRGSGRSEEVPPYTHKQWTADIDELRKYLNVEKIIIHGGSYGGFLSLEYVLRYPQHVGHVLLRDTGGNQKFHSLTVEKALNANLPDVTEDLLDRLFSGRVTSDKELKAMYTAILPLYTVEQNTEKMKEKAESIYYHYETHNYAFSENKPNYDVSEKLKTISCPVLVNVGRHDWVTPVEYSLELSEKIPNSTLIIYENSGHSPHAEENVQYLKNVREFLQNPLNTN
jgi:proline-specific peptidase